MPDLEQAAGRMAALLAVAVLALGAGACGDSDDDSQSSAGSPAADGSSTGESRPTPDEPSGSDRAARDERSDGESGANGSGDSAGSSGSGDSAGSGDAGGSDGSGASGSEEDEVRRVAEGMYRDMAAGDAAGVCAVMTDEARQRIAAQVPGGSAEPMEERTCVGSLSKFLEAAAQSGVLEQTLGASIRAVDVQGDRAVATLALAGASGKIHLQKENGEWRFGPSALNPNR